MSQGSLFCLSLHCQQHLWVKGQRLALVVTAIFSVHRPRQVSEMKQMSTGRGTGFVQMLVLHSGCIVTLACFLA